MVKMKKCLEEGRVFVQIMFQVEDDKVEDALFGIAYQFVSYLLRRTEDSGAAL